MQRICDVFKCGSQRQTLEGDWSKPVHHFVDWWIDRHQYNRAHGPIHCIHWSRPSCAHNLCLTFVGMEHCPLTDAKSIHQTISQYFQVRGIDISLKLVCVCSNGASVMTGINNGVGARLQNDNPHLLKICCIAHRLTLAVANSADDMDYPKDHETTMNSTRTHFNRSGKRMYQMVGLAKEFGLSLSRIQKSGKTRCVL